MIDHLSQGRFEFGMGRGSSSTEQKGFGIDDPELTKLMFDEVLAELLKMGRRPLQLRRHLLLHARAQRAAEDLHQSRTCRCGSPPATRHVREACRPPGLGILFRRQLARGASSR